MLNSKFVCIQQKLIVWIISIRKWSFSSWNISFTFGKQNSIETNTRNIINKLIGCAYKYWLKLSTWKYDLHFPDRTSHTHTICASDNNKVASTLLKVNKINNFVRRKQVKYHLWCYVTMAIYAWHHMKFSFFFRQRCFSNNFSLWKCTLHLVWAIAHIKLGKPSQKHFVSYSFNIEYAARFSLVGSTKKRCYVRHQNASSKP